MAIPLSKTLDPADFADLPEELAVVDRYFMRDREQHPMRRWEYALALLAHTVWAARPTPAGPIYDVGGSGSPFYRMLDPYQVHVIDPKEQHGQDLNAFVQSGPRLGAAVFCISVVEHIPLTEIDRFIYHLLCLTAPGGLLFLTVDYCDAITYPVPDTYDLHHMRAQIFNAYTLGQLTARFLYRDFSLLGPAKYGWHGTHVGPPGPTAYTFASIALVKRP